MSRTLLCGFGRTRPAHAELVPVRDERGIVAALAAGAVLARGAGHAYGDAAQAAGGTVLDMRALQGPLRVEGGAVEAPAGTSIGRLLEAALAHGAMVPVVPGTAQVTLGGAVAADAHGKNHHLDGSIARHLEWIDLVTADGRVRRVRPGGEPFEATVGGHGLTGVIAAARLRLLEVSGPGVLVHTARTVDLDGALAELDGPGRYSVAWLDLLAGPRGRGVVTRADHAPSPAAPARAPAARPVPPVAAAALRPTAVRAYNALRWARSPVEEADRPEPLHRHLFPLDALAGWPRLYGRGGLVQYQFAVPRGAESALRAVIELLWAARLPVLLAVLKRHGPGRSAAPLSFALEGHSLALDLPGAAPGLAAALDRADEIVATHGGRVYLAKDVRMRAAAVEAMYPRLGAWREARRRLDPEGRLRSDLGRRLGLC